VEKNNWQIVKESLTGDRVVDEQTFASLAVLEERLGHLRRRDEIFATVEFSDDVKKLQAQSNKVPVY
jgi:hypothetical protein